MRPQRPNTTTGPGVNWVRRAERTPPVRKPVNCARRAISCSSRFSPPALGTTLPDRRAIHGNVRKASDDGLVTVTGPDGRSYRVSPEVLRSAEARARNTGPVKAGGTTGLGKPRQTGPAAASPADGPQRAMPGDLADRAVIKSLGPATPGHGQRGQPPDDPMGHAYREPPAASVNSVVRAMSIMYVRCVSVLRHLHRRMGGTVHPSMNSVSFPGSAIREAVDGR
jgi:hypothetical protein